MAYTSRFLSCCVAAGLILGLASCKPESSAGSYVSAKLPIPGPAPAWKIKTVDGGEISSEQFKGKVVVLDFWATWCVPCVSEIPNYIALQKKYGKDGLVVIGVSMDSMADAPAAVKKFAADKAMNYTVAMGDDTISDAFGGISVIPTTFLIDREGIVRNGKVGAEDAASYETKVAALLRP